MRCCVWVSTSLHFGGAGGTRAYRRKFVVLELQEREQVIGLDIVLGPEQFLRTLPGKTPVGFEEGPPPTAQQYVIDPALLVLELFTPVLSRVLADEASAKCVVQGDEDLSREVGEHDPRVSCVSRVTVGFGLKVPEPCGRVCTAAHIARQIHRVLLRCWYSMLLVLYVGYYMLGMTALD